MLENQKHTLPAQLGGHLGTLAVLATYLGIYSYLIVKGDGLPYVMDNNETFSALNHAYNLWNFDFFQSFGLADEAVSPFAAAHPMVHTHQGNFPRLFSFLLFALGARTAEAQIWITTFTVGLAAVLMAKSFFRRLAGDLFATVATLMLLTDYLLFAQWQVNTYRVWHGFFLFGALLCAHGLAEWNRARWLAATISLYAALLYWELVFAAFVAVTAGAYTLWLYRRSFRQIVIAGTVQASGAALGLGTLIVQLLLYLGADGLITDLTYTYAARNLASDPGALVSTINAFYQKHNVIFWGNFQDTAQFSGPLAFLRSITTHVLQVHTPFLALILFSLATAALVADSRLPAIRDVALTRRSAAVSAIILAAGLFVFLFSLVVTGNTLLRLTSSFTAKVAGEALLLSLVLLPLIVVALSFALGRLSAAVSISGAPPGIRRCSVAGAYLAFFSVAPLLQGSVYHQGDQHLWVWLLSPANEWVAKLAFACSVLTGAFLILCGKRSLLGPLKDVPSSVAAYLACGLVGYLFVYKLTAGYVHTGYLYRLCPLLVFHADTLLALGLFTPLAIAVNLLRQVPESYARLSARGVAGISAALAIVLSVLWGLVQYRYSLLMPPDRFRFITALKSIVPPNHGIVSNFYAVPFGYVANTWAYLDSDFGKPERLDVNPSEKIERISYVWFADREHNPAYRRPGLFVCFQPLSWFPGLLDPSTPRLYISPRCSHTMIDAISRRTEKADDTLLEAKLIMRDETHDLWAIYRLEWRNSPDRKKHPATP